VEGRGRQGLETDHGVTATLTAGGALKDVHIQ
jgi:hypothetical protein